MLDETFAEAIVHAPAPLIARVRGYTAHKVLGFHLRPFSFWHAFNLDLVRSPLVGGLGLYDFKSIYTAACCCRLKWPQVISHELTTPLGRFQTWLTSKHLLKKFCDDDQWRLGQINAMTAYVLDYFACVPESVDEGETKPLRIPWYLYYVSLLLEYDLRKGRRLTQGEAWDSPIPESRWWILACHQAKGNYVDVVSPEDRIQLREAKDQGIEFVRE